MEATPPDADAATEIEDDWLNYFARLAEDKSSEELQLLFGRILSGEIRKPGSFSLRTLLFMSTISKQEAETLTNLLAFAIDRQIIPFREEEDKRPTLAERLLLEELGVGGSPSVFGGIQFNRTIKPGQKYIFQASQRGILLENETELEIEVSIGGQGITRIGKELIPIANAPITDIEFLKHVTAVLEGELKKRYPADIENKRINIHVVSTEPVEGGIKYNIIN